MSVESTPLVEDASVLPSLALGLAGAVGGMASLVVTYPLYTVTMQQQAHVDDAAGEGEADLSAPSGKVAGSTPSAAVAVVKRILRDEGWGGLFKGLKSALIANGLQSAVYYYFYAYFKRLHRRGPGGRLVPAMSALAAAEAGVASVLLTNPLWEVNMRQVTSATALRSEGFLQALREIVAEEGVGGLYRGVFPALLLVSVPTSQFWVYELSLRALARIVAPNHRGVPTRLLLSPTVSFLLGAWSKVCATILTFPLQTIRTLLVAAAASGRQTVRVTGIPAGASEVGVRRLLEGITGATVQQVRLMPAEGHAGEGGGGGGSNGGTQGLWAFAECASLGRLPADGLDVRVLLDPNTGDLPQLDDANTVGNGVGEGGRGGSGGVTCISPGGEALLRVEPVTSTVHGRIRVVLAEHGIKGLFNGIGTKLLQSPATAAFHLLFRLQIIRRLKQRYPAGSG